MQALEVFFIPATPERVIAPAFPVAPQRPTTPQPADRARIATAHSAPPDPQETPATTPESSPPPLNTARLLDIAEMAARAAIEPGSPAATDPTRRQRAKLPGRAEPYTPEAIQLRDRISPADVVAFIGSLTGGNYDPCPDTRSKIRDLTSRNDARDEDELRALIDRERRRCR